MLLQMTNGFLQLESTTFVTVGFKKNGNCQEKFCQILLNFYSFKRPFRIYVKKLHLCVRNTTVKQAQIDIN
jgi:hypothetical protein